MYLKTLLLFGILWAHYQGFACAPQNGDLPAANAAPAPPVAKALMKASQGSSTSGCLADTECPDDQYCGGRPSSKRKRCVECYDCAKMERSFKKTYDGKVCAHHQSECGECNPGYTDKGGACLPLNDFNLGVAPSILLQEPVGHINSLQQSDEEKEKLTEETKAAALNPLIIVLLLVGVVGFLGVAIVVGYHRGSCTSISAALRPKRGGAQTSNEGESLTSYNNCSFDQPSAPPDEYGRQLPYHTNNNMSWHNNNGYEMPCNRRVIKEMGQGALPFDRGNGGGEWVVTGEDTAQVPDETDSNPNVPQQSASTTSGSNNGNANGRGRGNLNRQSNRRSVPAQRNVAVHQPPPPPPVGGIGLGNPQNNEFQPRHPFEPHQDIVMGQFRFSLNFGIAYNRTPGTAVVSAPSSPRPGRIDDTFMALNEMPQVFNTSRDSGTGTDDEQQYHLVPSHSVSGNDFGNQDLGNDSFLYDNDVEPNRPQTPPAPPVVAPPRLAQQIANEELRFIFPPIQDFPRRVENMDDEDSDMQE